jgi:thioredoxin-related protein
MQNLVTRLASLVLALGVALPALAAELVMVERQGCHWCERWNAEIAPIFPKTDEGRRAPLRRVDIKALPDDLALTSQPVFTPTFVLVEGGRELGRIEGYAGDEFFWFLLTQLLDTQGVPPASP